MADESVLDTITDVNCRNRIEAELRGMIHLTRLNNRMLVVNSDLVKFIENAPDTVITLVSGEKIVVLETAEEIITRIVRFRRRLNEPATVLNESNSSFASSLSAQVEEQPSDSAAPSSPDK